MVVETDKYKSYFQRGGENDILKRAEKAQENKEQLHIVVAETMEFVDTISSTLTTTTDLAIKINTVFNQVFADYHGCNIGIDNTGRVVMNLVFRAINPDPGDERTVAFKPIELNNDTDPNKKVSRLISTINLTNSNSNRMRLTQDGCELLYGILEPGIKNNMKNIVPESFNKIVGETVARTGYIGQENIFCTVNCIDVIKVLGILYGSRDVKEGSIVYAIYPKRPVDNQQVPNPNFIIEIQRMTQARYNAFMANIGCPTTDMVTAVTATMPDDNGAAVRTGGGTPITPETVQSVHSQPQQRPAGTTGEAPKSMYENQQQ